MVRTIPSFVNLTIGLQIFFYICQIKCAKATNSSTNKPSIRYMVATLQTFVRQTRSLDAGEPVAQWRLFNECSQGFMQSFLRTVNALGRREDVCLTHFIVWMRHSDGTLALQNAQTQHFLCLSRRLRLTTMTRGSSLKCRYREHMNRSGYTLIESAWSVGTFLGFGKNGHSVNSIKNQTKRRRCFLFNKLESSLPREWDQTLDCTTASRQSKLQSAPKESHHQQFVDSSFLNDIFQKSIHRVFAYNV